MRNCKRLFGNGYEYNKLVLPITCPLKSFQCQAENISQIERIMFKMNDVEVQYPFYV